MTLQRSFKQIPSFIQLVFSRSDNLKKKYGKCFLYDINPSCEMYGFLKNHPGIQDPVSSYFSSGEKMLATFKEILSVSEYNVNNIESLLDFACGYGRFTRFLTTILNPKKITVADVCEPAVDFCKEKLGVKGFYSKMDYSSFTHDIKYDVIWVASLFSHLAKPLWLGWFNVLCNMLKTNGLLIFSTHGRHCLDTINDEQKKIMQKYLKDNSDDFIYYTFSETNRLNGQEYGSAFVNPAFVQKVASENSDFEFLSFYAHKLWSFQDVYVIKRLK